jgi:hypothetical protein
MTRLIRRLLALVGTSGVVLAAVLGAGAALAPPAAAAAATTVDGVVLHHLPAGLGTSSDFAYSYDDVEFAARVWESGSDATAWRVDLAVDVLRGRRLDTPAALHDWFIAYEERPPAEVHYRPVRVRGHRGWLTRDEVFWLLRPGLAVAIRLDVPRWPEAELLRTARGARFPHAPRHRSAPGRR